MGLSYAISSLEWHGTFHGTAIAEPRLDHRGCGVGAGWNMVV